MQPLSGNQRPDFLTSLRHMSFVLLLPWKMHLCRSSSNAPRLLWFLEMRQNHHVLLIFDKVHNPLRLPREMHLCRSSSNVPRLPWFLEMLQNPHVLLTFEKVHNPLRLPRTSTSERPKVLRTRQFLALLTSKCASCHNGCTFSTSQLLKVVRSWCVL